MKNALGSGLNYFLGTSDSPSLYRAVPSSSNEREVGPTATERTSES